MFKLIFILILISALSKAQENITNLAKDSDAFILSHINIAVNKITKIIFTEHIDSLQFLGYPLPYSNINFLQHQSIINKKGLATHYEWSFTESEYPQVKEIEKSSGIFFIPNEYDYEYDDFNVNEITISDVSPIYKIVYTYTKDSIYQDIFIYNSNDSTKIVKHSYSFNFNNLFKKHTEIKQQFFPANQIINLGIISSNSILINNLPFTVFFAGKFETNRFIMEIRPGMWIFFEIND